MLRFTFFFTVSYFILIGHIQAQNNSKIVVQTDTLIITDTLRSTETITAYTYDHPLHYNLVGIMYHGNANWYTDENHVFLQSYIAPELFCNFSRKNSLFSIALRYNQFQEKTKYTTEHLITSESIFTQIDTISWYQQVIGEDTVITYIIEQNNISVIDTQKVDSLWKFNQKIHTVSIPLRYGYYINHGFWRYNIGLAVIPTYMFFSQTSISEKSRLIQPKNQCNIYLEPTFEVTYWFFSKIFLHAKITYSRALIPYKSDYNNNIYHSNLYAGVGISYLFFDKTWE